MAAATTKVRAVAVMATTIATTAATRAGLMTVISASSAADPWMRTR